MRRSKQSSKGRTRVFCNATCRKGSHRARGEAWDLGSIDPKLADAVPSLEDMYRAQGGDSFDIKAWFRDLEAQGVVPPRSQRQGIAGARRAPRPSPEKSTPDHVKDTLVTALAVAGQFRRHGIAAEGLLAVKCAAVSAVLDEVLVREFGDVL